MADQLSIRNRQYLFSRLGSPVFTRFHSTKSYRFAGVATKPSDTMWPLLRPPFRPKMISAVDPNSEPNKKVHRTGGGRAGLSDSLSAKRLAGRGDTSLVTVATKCDGCVLLVSPHSS